MALKFFDMTRSGGGVKKTDGSDYSLKRFFVLTKENFWKLAVVNIFYVFSNFPVFFALYAASGNLNIPFSTPGTVAYQALFGVMQSDASPALYSMWGIGARLTQSGYASTATVVFYLIGLLVLFTFGVSNAGMACVVRNLSRSTPLDLAHDYFGTIKKNLKQALPMGVIDAFAVFALSFDVFFFYQNSLYSADFVTLVLLFISLFVYVVYLMMRPYIYIIMITFDLKLTKILKNALLFSMLALKRNIFALASNAIIVVVNYLLFLFITPIGAILPFVITFSLCSFVAGYAAWAPIKKYMIDPYYTSPESASAPEPIFRDDVSG